MVKSPTASRKNKNRTLSKSEKHQRRSLTRYLRLAASFPPFSAGAISGSRNSRTSNWSRRVSREPAFLAGLGHGSRHPRSHSLSLSPDWILQPRISTFSFGKLYATRVLPVLRACRMPGEEGARRGGGNVPRPYPARTSHRDAPLPWPLALTYFPSTVIWQAFDVTLALLRLHTTL